MNRPEVINEKYFTVPELAAMLHLRKSYVYELINRDEIKAIKFSARRTRIPESALNDLIAEKKILSFNDSRQEVRPPKRGRKKCR